MNCKFIPMGTDGIKCAAAKSLHCAPLLPLPPPLPSGKEPMYHRQLAAKRVERSKAKKVIADVIVCRGRDKVSKLYKRLE